MICDPRQQDQRRRFDELYERSLAPVMYSFDAGTRTPRLVVRPASRFLLLQNALSERGL